MYRDIAQTRHWLVTLLALDALLIGIHFCRSALTPFRSAMFSLTEDGGVPELFQYAKWLAIAVCMADLAYRRHSRGFALWALMGTYLLAEDALMVHERVGDLVRDWHPFEAPLGLRLDDVGELATVAVMGLAFAVAFGLGYRRASDEFRHATHDLAMLLGALGIVGVGVDMLSVMLEPGPSLGAALVAIEDGGEMLVASVMVWYAAMLASTQRMTGARRVPLTRLRPALEEALGRAA